MNPASQSKLSRFRALFLTGALALVAGNVYAADVTIGGRICEGQKVQSVNETGQPIMVPDVNCGISINTGQVMVQDLEGDIITYGTVNGNTWTAQVPAPVSGINQYVVMYSAPGHDATSREYRVDAAGTHSIVYQDAYLAPTPLPTANLLVYVFKDKYLNTEDDFPSDPPFNGVRFVLKDERGNVVTTDASGNPFEGNAVSGSQTQIITTDGIVINDTSGLYYFKNLKPGDYEVEMDTTSLPACEATTYTEVCDTVNGTACVNPIQIASRCNGRGWIQNSTIEGGNDWEVSLFPGDPGTMAGGYLAWFSFIENLDNNLGGGADAGSIVGELRDSDGPFFAALGEPWAPSNPNVFPNEAVKDGLVVLWKSTAIVDAANSIVNPQPVAVATTDANGRFSFTNVPPGAYKLFWEDKALHYIWQEKGVAVQPNQAVEFLDGTLTGGADSALYMPKWYGVIHGYAVDTTGQPVNEQVDCSLDAGGALLCQYAVPRDVTADPTNGIPGLRVTLHASNGSVWKETTTCAVSPANASIPACPAGRTDGYYRFDTLNEIEVLGHVKVDAPAGYHASVTTESYPFIDYVREPGFVDPWTGMGHAIPTIDGTNVAQYRIDLSGRTVGWFAANYRADLQLERIPAGSGDIKGAVHYDSLEQGIWIADGQYDQGDERIIKGATLELLYADGTPVKCADSVIIDPAYCGNVDGNVRTKSAGVDKPMMYRQGYMSGLYPPDEFGGVFHNTGTLGRYEFRGIPAGDYRVRVVSPAQHGSSAAPAYVASPLGSEERPVSVVAEQSQEIHFGLTTYTPQSITAAAPMGVPLAGEIEGGTFDDLNLQTNTESILWDEKKPLAYTSVGIYDHLGYFLGAQKMGNDLCHRFSAHLGDLTVCPNGEEGPELEYRSAPGPHIYVGNNDKALWLVEYTCQDTPREVTTMNPNTNLPEVSIDNGVLRFPYPHSAAQAATCMTICAPFETQMGIDCQQVCTPSSTYCYRDNANPWLPGSAYYPGYEPLPWTYNFGQGKNKYEADWSLLPLFLQIEGAPIGGPLGTALINPQDRPVINNVLVP